VTKERRSNASAGDAPVSGPGESGLARWSRRKALARAAREPGAPAEPGDAACAAADSAAAEKTDADMPPIESLHEDSDYAAFLSPKVSEKLRRMALRKLFQLPQFNFRDGLDDYAEDYRNFEPLGDIITADMRHRMEREVEALKQRLQDGAEPENAGHDNENPAPAVAAAEPATESPDTPDVESAAPAAGTPESQDPSKG
jgi:Protein of unknown function (DUF3306)